MNQPHNFTPEMRAEWLRVAREIERLGYDTTLPANDVIDKCQALLAGLRRRVALIDGSVQQ